MKLFSLLQWYYIKDMKYLKSLSPFKNSSNALAVRFVRVYMYTSLVDEEDLTKECPPEGGDFSLHSPAVSSSSHSPSLPVTPPSPSPAVSPSSPPGVSTPTNSNSPCHPRSLTPSSTPSCSTNPASPSAAACSSALPPQGPGPGGGTSFDGGTMAIGPGGPTGPVSLAAGATPRSRSLDLPQQRSTDSDKESSFSIPTKHRQHYHGSKLKLLQRSHAMQEDSSPPPDIIDPCLGGSFSHSQMSNSLTGCPGGPPRRRLRHQGSSPGSFDGSSPCLSRDSSMEYTDSTGVDLLSFIIQTLHKNQKDRMLLLKIERELVNMVKDPNRQTDLESILDEVKVLKREKRNMKNFVQYVYGQM
ncbi:R3H domain-containing protein 2 [Armadillidium nasatum]|uniref:R3H domain-containing protein 2 n=1 Tax=Armadillidium nasatum TaxID=96803 RepID=A0A5N5SUG9_9CRUS|nr:R3H domain-containing protein 2 [Armadillidium nasatum]